MQLELYTKQCDYCERTFRVTIGCTSSVCSRDCFYLNKNKPPKKRKPSNLARSKPQLVEVEVRKDTTLEFLREMGFYSFSLRKEFKAKW
jgi:hypothetical protein